MAPEAVLSKPQLILDFFKYKRSMYKSVLRGNNPSKYAKRRSYGKESNN